LQANTTASTNTAVGRNSLYTNTEGAANVAVGYSALNGNTTGNENTALGYQALDVNTTGDENVAVGRTAMAAQTTGDDNVAVGGCSLKASTTGTQNTAVGYKALLGLTVSYGNAAVGICAGRSITGSNGNNNTMMGIESGCNITTGYQNVTLGWRSGADSMFNITSENNRLAVGHNAITNSYVKVDWTVTSDKRDKTEIADVPHGLEFVNQMKPVSFKFKKSRENPQPHGFKKYGFLAQDILELEGSDNVIIDNENEENLKVTNSHLIPVLVNAVQELSKQNEEMKLEINELKKDR
jgi:hypothetical protein